MHILLIPSWYKTPQNPIRGSFFIEQAQALQKAGHQVGMLVPPSRFRTWNGLSELRRFWSRSPYNFTIDRDDGFPAYRIPWWGWRASINPYIRVNIVNKVFRKYCNDQGTPDILHGHGLLYGSYLAAMLGQISNIPSVGTIHSSGYRKGVVPFQLGQQLFIHNTLHKLNAIVLVTPSLQVVLQHYGVTKEPYIVGNMIDVGNFSLGPSLVNKEPFIFAIIARLIALKRHDLLLRAFAIAFKGKNVRLLIAGDGNLFPNLRKLVHMLGIESQVQFLGLLPRIDIPNLLHHSHVVVSTSDREANPVNLLEALCCGRPIIATQSGGPEYFIKENNGLLIPRNDEQALVIAMKQIYKTYANYTPQQIRKTCLKQYSEDAIVQQLETIYYDLTSNNS